ncbi:MAG: PIN domain-containing protein [Actinomycetia bacterium]|nr:PIN domain-containing protein [Actinomycetes bacterium]
MDPVTTRPVPIQVVLADSNVLYSRALRDYLLCAAEMEVVGVNWSQEILDEVTEHLVVNLPSFTEESAKALTSALADTFPRAIVNPSAADYARLADIALPDGDDRHVIAAALAADAKIVCTGNVRHFPAAVMAQLGIVVMTPDELFTQLIYTHLPQMVAAHRAAVAAFHRATDESTLTALRRAGATKTADLMTAALGLTDN